jgi:hypothetical protein
MPWSLSISWLPRTYTDFLHSHLPTRAPHPPARRRRSQRWYAEVLGASSLQGVKLKVRRPIAASFLAIALLLATATPSHAQHGRVFIWWAPPYPYPYGYPPPYYAWAEEAERRAMAQVLLTTEAPLLSGCTRVGLVSDDSVKDLRRKIVRAGGNAAVRCTTTARAPANTQLRRLERHRRLLRGLHDRAAPGTLSDP